MASIIDSLFGPTPYDVGQARNQQDMSYAEKVARMGGFEQAKFGIGQGAAGLTRAGAGMMGMVDPLQQEAAMREGVMGMGGDLTTSAGLKAKAMQFAQAGDQRTAMKLAIAAKQQEAQEQEMALKRAQELAALHKASAEASPVGKIDPSKFTQESVKAWFAGGMKDPSLLVAIESSSDTSDIKNYNKAVTQGYKGTFNDWLLASKKAGAGSTTNVMPGTEAFKDIPKFRKDVQDTVKPQIETIYAADKALSALDLSIKNNNASAFQVARTQLAKTAGDSQISLREIEAAGGDPSLFGKILDTGSVLFTGTPTIETQMNMKRTIEAIRKVAKQKGKAEIEVQRSLARDAKFSDDQIAKALKFDQFEDAATGSTISDAALIKKHLKKKPNG